MHAAVQSGKIDKYKSLGVKMRLVHKNHAKGTIFYPTAGRVSLIILLTFIVRTAACLMTTISTVLEERHQNL